MADTTRSDADDLFTGSRSFSESTADNLVAMANRLGDDVYGDRIRATGEVEGNEKDFKTALACHIWELKEGGESQSESQTGGSISYNSAASNPDEWLSLTRYGIMATGYLRSQASIGVEKT